MDQIPDDIHLKSPQEILEIARQFIGSETEPVEARYPVEYDPIRRYCQMTGDTNPLFLDSGYAKKTKYGEVLCPALMLGYFGGLGNWPPVTQQRPAPRTTIPLPPQDGPRRGINLATDWTFFKTVKVGDRLSAKSRVADVYMKAIKSDPECIWTRTERIITNQNDEVVAVGENTIINYKK